MMNINNIIMWTTLLKKQRKNERFPKYLTLCIINTCDVGLVFYCPFIGKITLDKYENLSF